MVAQIPTARHSVPFGVFVPSGVGGASRSRNEHRAHDFHSWLDWKGNMCGKWRSVQGENETKQVLSKHDMQSIGLQSSDQMVYRFSFSNTLGQWVGFFEYEWPCRPWLIPMFSLHGGWTVLERGKGNRNKIVFGGCSCMRMGHCNIICFFLTPFCRDRVTGNCFTGQLPPGIGTVFILASLQMCKVQGKVH